MVAYLASHISGYYTVDGKRYPACLNGDNGLVEKLKARWPDPCNVLIIGTAPDCYERNDSLLTCFRAAFPMSGLPISGIRIIDDRNEALIEKLSEFQVIILSGGHVPSQNSYFKKLCVKERLAAFDGILLGISAGTMNSAEIVYAQPELEGESNDPTYQRFLPGLGLTKVMVIPHYQQIKDDLLDGKRLFEDITYPDSFGREFYALADGSFLEVENSVTTLFGAAYIIKDGAVHQICKKDEHIRIE